MLARVADLMRMIDFEKTRRVSLLIFGWYMFSISLQVYNKWLFSPTHNDFHYPLFTTMIHMFIQSLLSTLAVKFIYPELQPKKSPSKQQYLINIIPCGLATGLDIGLSNSSLKYISLSFYTMVKSAAPVFILLFAVLFKLEKFSTKLTASIMVIVIGVIIMVSNETKFNMFGYFEIQLATVLSGLRWSLTQLLLKNHELGLDNPLATSMYLSPVVGGSLLFASMIVEDWVHIFNAPQFENMSMAVFLISSILGGGCLAFMMINVEFQLICTTSVMTLSVAGIFKEVLTIIASVTIFGDVLTTNVLLGLIISIVGIAGIIRLTKRTTMLG
jgi:solute carrier family 35 protein C2